jgi:hypothetical protein
MADNTTLNPGTGGDLIASDDIGGVKFQRVKPAWGADGTAVDVSQANPLPVTASNITGKFREAFETLSPGNWTTVVATGDIVQVDGNTAAASYLTISRSPWDNGTETTITAVPTFKMPVELAFGAHLSQRTLGQEFAIELVDTSAPLADVPDLAISAIAQTTTTLTVTTALPHGLTPGKSIGIRGVLDTRVNYPAVVVASIPSPNQFTVTAGPGGAIASLSAYTASVLASTTAALPANAYANGTLGVGATLTASANGAFPDQDGVAIPLNGRVLVRFEATAANNGVYVLTQAGSAGTPWILTRATDYDTVAELTVVAGALFAVSVYVSGGTTHSQKEFYLSATVTTVGTTAVTWVDSTYTGPLGFVYFRERFGRANNGVAQIFENATATNASLYVRSESGDALPSGTVAGSHSVTIGTTASVQLVNAAYAYAFAPTTEFRINLQADRTQWYDSAVDAVAQTASRLLRTQVCPDPGETYKLRIRASNNKSVTVLTARVVSVSKPGTTVGTFTTATAHGLVTGDLIVYYGNSNTAAAAFPNLTAATAVTVLTATTFTVAAIGTAATVTGYGGVIAKVQGGNLLSALGATTITAINATLSTLSDGQRQLVLTGSATWTGVVIGDYVNAEGVTNVTDGATLGVDGAWKVANIATTSLSLVPCTPAFAATLPADFVLTNSGGAVIRRTCLRTSFIRVFDYERQRVENLARPSGDISAAAPVTVQNTAAVTVTSGAVAGTVAVDAAIGAPVTAGLRASSANIAAMSATGDNVAWQGTMIGVGVVKPFAIPEADWQTPAAVGGLLNTATPLQIKEAAGAGIRNYVTAVDMFSEALTNATDLRIREPDLTCSSQTIASNTLTVSATHNLGIGDAVVFTAATVTGITVGVTYYVLTTPAVATLTLSANRGGSTLAISGTTVTATFHKVLWQTRIPTTGRPAGQILFPTPLRGSVNTPLQLQTATASGAGAVHASLQGYFAP